MIIITNDDLYETSVKDGDSNFEDASDVYAKADSIEDEKYKQVILELTAFENTQCEAAEEEI